MNIVEDYVSFEIAKLLKEKGFNGLCNGYYDCFTTENFHSGCEPTDFNSIDIEIRDIVSAPTLQMAMKWLRKEYNIDILITIGGFIEKGKVYFCLVYKNLTNYGDLKECSTYEEACDAGIRYCLENLI